MEIIGGLENFSLPSQNTVLAIGNFDGIHLGHQKILQSLAQESKKLELPSLVLTFSPHPGKILSRSPIRMIQTFEQRLEQVEKFAVQTVIVIPFEKDFANLTSQEFIQKIVLDKLRAQEVIVGENFRFGKNREGDLSSLRCLAASLNFKVQSISSYAKEGQIISSSLIRNLLQNGEIEKANSLLGRTFEITGEVIRGKSMGKHLGFPTANIKTDNEIIPQGVFITTVFFDGQNFPSLTNVGKCPTFNQEESNIESYIINFDANLYGKKIKILFESKIRDEIQFDFPEDLSRQIERDLTKAKSYFKIS